MQLSFLSLVGARVQSQIEYCLPVWGNALDTHMKPMKIIQRKIIRVITNSKYNSHSEPLFSQAKALTIEDMYLIRCARIGMKLTKNRANVGLQSCFKVVDSVNRITRQGAGPTKKLYVPLPRIDLTKRLPQFQIPAIWNAFPDKYKRYGILALMDDFKRDKIDKYDEFVCTLKKCYPCGRI